MTCRFQVHWNNFRCSNIDVKSGNFSIHIFNAEDLFCICCLFLSLCMAIVKNFHTGVNSRASVVSDNAWLPSANWADYANVDICIIMTMELWTSVTHVLKNSFELQFVGIKQGAEKVTLMKIINRCVKKKGKMWKCSSGYLPIIIVWRQSSVIGNSRCTWIHTGMKTLNNRHA